MHVHVFAALRSRVYMYAPCVWIVLFSCGLHLERPDFLYQAPFLTHSSLRIFSLLYLRNLCPSLQCV